MLDAHVSGPRVGTALEEMGHDVRAVDQEKELERLPDESLLELAVSDSRILVTHNAGDFARIVQQRSPEKPHAGVIFISPSVRLDYFGTMIRGIQRTLGDLSQEDWVDRVEWMKKGE